MLFGLFSSFLSVSRHDFYYLNRTQENRKVSMRSKL